MILSAEPTGECISQLHGWVRARRCDLCQQIGDLRLGDRVERWEPNFCSLLCNDLAFLGLLLHRLRDP